MIADDRRTRLTLLALALLVLVCHYLPPERAGMGPDDYKLLWRYHDGTLAGDLMEGLQEQRPLMSIGFALRAKFLSHGAALGYALPLVASCVLILAVYCLIKRLVKSVPAARLCAVAFTLLPQSHEVHQSAVYFSINLPCAAYVFAAERFLAFSEDGRRRNLVLSWLCYTIGLWSYEAGALLPIGLAIVCAVQGRSRSMWLLGHFALAMLYGAFTFASYLPWGVAKGRAVGFGAGRLLRLVHHYAGFYLAQTTVYGLWNFVQLPWVWLSVLIIVDAVILWWIWSAAADEAAMQLPRHALVAALVLGVFFLMPVLLQPGTDLAGRHLLLPSIPVCMFLIAGLRKLRRRKEIAVAFGALGLIVAEGTAWTQVVASRLNGAVYRTLQEQKTTLSASDHLVFDLASFRERIAHTWVPREFEYVNTYFGAQAFAEWGLESMVWLAAGRADPQVHFAVTSPVVENDRLHFVAGRFTGSRALQKTPASLPREGTFVLDFTTVFGDSFRSGAGRPRRGGP